jgi:hypothetical protein
MTPSIKRNLQFINRGVDTLDVMAEYAHILYKYEFKGDIGEMLDYLTNVLECSCHVRELRSSDYPFWDAQSVEKYLNSFYDYTEFVIKRIPKRIKIAHTYKDYEIIDIDVYAVLPIGWISDPDYFISESLYNKLNNREYTWVVLKDDELDTPTETTVFYDDSHSEYVRKKLNLAEDIQISIIARGKTVKIKLEFP